MDTGCCLEDLPGAMDDREREAYASSVTWWWLPKKRERIPIRLNKQNMTSFFSFVYTFFLSAQTGQNGAGNVTVIIVRRGLGYLSSNPIYRTLMLLGKVWNQPLCPGHDTKLHLVKGYSFGLVLWHINHCRLFNAKSSSYIYIKYI